MPSPASDLYRAKALDTSNHNRWYYQHLVKQRVKSIDRDVATALELPKPKRALSVSHTNRRMRRAAGEHRLRKDLAAIGSFEVELRANGEFEHAARVNHLTCELERKLPAVQRPYRRGL